MRRRRIGAILPHRAETLLGRRRTAYTVGFLMDRARLLRPGPPSCLYSPNCAEIEFAEVRACAIGWQLFVLGSSQSDSVAFLLLLATYATRLLARLLSQRRPLSTLARFAPFTPARLANFRTPSVRQCPYVRQCQKCQKGVFGAFGTFVTPSVSAFRKIDVLPSSAQLRGVRSSASPLRMLSTSESV
jgi:hypothetical protein